MLDPSGELPGEIARPWTRFAQGSARASKMDLELRPCERGKVRSARIRLPSAPRRSKWWILATQFKSTLILILLGAAALSFAIGNGKDAIVIACVVVANALFGFYEEYRAERSLAALKDMLPILARVRRMGRMT
jgi:magnesium-transporting ATPase (P-type)